MGPISPEPVLGSGAPELPAYVSNGLIGLRVRDIPLFAGMALISGYSGVHPERRIEAAAAAPYPLAADICLGGVWLSDVPHQARDLSQAVDFSCGELTTKFTFEAAGLTARIEVLTFCSRADPTLVCQEINIETGSASSISVRAIIDGQDADGALIAWSRTTPGEAQAATDGMLLWESAGGLSRCGFSLVSELVGAEAGAAGRPDVKNSRLTTEHHAAKARRLKLRQIVSVVPSALHERPHEQAARLAAKAKFDGFDAVRAANRGAWAELWKSRIVLVGADRRFQALADAAFFYLNSSVHRSSPASTSIFGLATWHDYHYYYGHVMWDIEAFAVAPLSLLQPDAAGALLDYRFRNLAAARRNARLFGRRGLQFPWESAPQSGEEASPLPGTGSWHEDHVSLDVARAFQLHGDITGDPAFLRERAWPVLAGVCEWLESRSSKTSRGTEIKASMGIAERKAPVENAAFTNMAAAVILRAAADTAERLGFVPPPLWRKMAETMVIPKRGEVIVSHDGFRVNEEKGGTPDPLMGLFPFGFPASPVCEAATLEFYLRLADDYIGSPMLSALYGAWAARAGDRVRALDLLDAGYGAFCAGRFLQTLEYRADRFPEQPKAGPFFANIGGFLTSLLFGFTGLEPNAAAPRDWARRGVVLPAGWEAIEVGQVWVRGEPARLAARQGSPRAELI